jgi:hypothetical protein
MRFKKIKVVENEKIEMTYEKVNKNGSFDVFSFISNDPATPELYEAFAELALDIKEMCEQSAEVERIAVTTLSLSYKGDDDVLGVVISGKLQLKNSHGVVALNTPVKYEEVQGEGELARKGLLTDFCQKRIYKMIEFSEQYVNGARAQGTLFPETVIPEMEVAKHEPMPIHGAIN